VNLEQLLRDYNIPHVSGGHKHTSAGWVNINCPFCSGSKNFPLGIRESMDGCNCWRCGGHSLANILSKTLGCTLSEAFKIIDKYRTGKTTIRQIAEPKVSIHPFKYPSPNHALNQFGRKYLKKRKFDPDHLIKEWGISQTGPVSFLDKISYCHRILIPIYWDGKIVSFQARDITGKSELKYLTCPKAREIHHHKNILYGRQEYWKNSNGLIIVEGVTDVWRLGINAVATFGIKFKKTQVLELAKAHDRFFIVFDSEPQAQEQAKKLSTALKTLGKKTHIEKIKGDPGEMEQEEANELVKTMLK